MKIGTRDEILLRKDRCALCFFISEFGWTWINRDHWFISPEDLPMQSLKPTEKYKIADSEHIHASIAKIGVQPDQHSLFHPLHIQRVSHTPDKSFLQGLGGRLVPPEVDPNLVKRWLHICDTKHSGGCCRSLGDLNDIGTFAPKFFIDVVDSYVVRATLDCRYVALSYVWGDTKTTKRLEHVTENSSKLQEPNLLRNMYVPRTIHESMVLVKKIGLRYLWVDALCIIQNDIQMSHLQISKMDQIYAKACLTIIAASGDNAQAGLPGVHPRTQEKRQRICQLPGCDIATLICDGFPVSSIANSTWASRAWTMQEMLLSRRCLIFTEDQVYWVCREFTYLEEIALEDTAASLLHLLPWPISARLPTEPIPLVNIILFT